MPRVISGTAGGLRLKAPAGKGTRPSADRTKEGLFSALSARLHWPGLRVLELFAGSGQLGIECLSRGAAAARFVERSRACCALIRANLAHTGLAERAEVVCGDALRQAERMARAGEGFDLILLDPPYAEARAQMEKLEGLIAESGLLAPGGLLVLESDAKRGEPFIPAHLALLKSCQYGLAMVSFYGHARA